MERRLRKNVTVGEVLRSGKVATIAPKPDEMRDNVNAVLHYIMQSDLEKDEHNIEGNTTTPRLKRTFIASPTKIADKTRKQMTHVNKGCLSDPIFEEGDDEYENFKDIRLHIQCGKKCFCCRGTEGNEAGNAVVKEVLNAPCFGIQRAERALDTKFDDWNTNRNIKRHGAKYYKMRHTESLAFANSLSRQCGHNNRFENISRKSDGRTDRL